LSTALRSDLAESDLLEVWLFIAQDSPSAADRFLDLIDEKIALLADFPEMGRRRDELSMGLRSFPIGRYVIFYRQKEDGVEIARVLSAYRDLNPIFH
jgi:toxin ParE1/3/4